MAPCPLSLWLSLSRHSFATSSGVMFLAASAAAVVCLLCWLVFMCAHSRSVVAVEESICLSRCLVGILTFTPRGRVALVSFPLATDREPVEFAVDQPDAQPRHWLIAATVEPVLQRPVCCYDTRSRSR